MLLDVVIIVTISCLVVRLIYCLSANELATNKLVACSDEINLVLLKGTDLQMCDLGYYDCSPCEVTFGIYTESEWSIERNNLRGLPSRIFLRYIKRIKSGKMSIEELRTICLNMKLKEEKKNKLRQTV